MGTVNVVLGEDTRLNLILGQQLENAVTEVVFDFSAWKTTYGTGTLALSVQRPGDDQPYAVALTTSGTNATWSVTNLDTAYKGVGHIQLTYTVGSAIKKSVVYKFTVYESLGANGEYPSPGQTWQEEIEADIADVKQDLDVLIPSKTINLDGYEIRGYFVSDLGDIRQTSGSFAYTNPIPVVKGYAYEFTAQGSTIVAALCSSNASGNTKTVIKTYTATDVQETIKYTPSADGYIIVSYNYNQNHTLTYKAVSDSVESISETVNAISEQNENLIDLSDIVIGENWQLSDASDRAVLTFEVDPLTEYVFDFPQNNYWFTINAVEKNSATSTASINNTQITNGGTTTLTTKLNTRYISLQFACATTVTSGMFNYYYPAVYENGYTATAIDRIARINTMPWQGKKLVWLGTSIPAGGKYDVNNKSSYPLMVGKQIGATVYNEAVGSSALHCKDPNRISTANPYGFLANFEAVSRCITNSSEEMEWIIEHYNDSNVFTQGVPSSLSDADKEFIRSCSWEIKLQKYFTSENFPDAWIIDHGHNDIPSEYSESTYTAKSAMVGTQHDGYYNGGNFVQSTASSYLEFDVSDELYIWISGTFGSYYDRYDLYDSDGNNIGWFAQPSETTINDMKVNVVDATTLRVSNINTLINTVTVKKLTYPMYNSLYSYQGGFDFVVNKIKEYNPRARIIMIGEYENQKYPTISENQIIASERWEFPLYRQWENLGWSQQYVKVNGEYITYLNYFIPDNLHPHSDTTGWALEQIANNISAWLKTIA